MVTSIESYGIPLCCPLCKGELKHEFDTIICYSCESTFYQEKKEFINLLPETVTKEGEQQWQERQKEMELWYKNLLVDVDAAVSLFEHDYDPYKIYLSNLSGNILDLGGGVGIVRHYLSDKANYIVVDPSADWLNSDWQLLSRSYPCLRENLKFIMGTGEFLMFDDNMFDTVLSFWSINHVSQPAQVFQEVQRVLKPGGTFFVVFEDMEPRWSDFLKKSMRRYFDRESLKEIISMKVNVTLFRRSWPVQHDHILITEKNIKTWIKPLFQQKKREWKGAYLTYEFIKY